MNPVWFLVHFRKGIVFILRKVKFFSVVVLNDELARNFHLIQ